MKRWPFGERLYSSMKDAKRPSSCQGVGCPMRDDCAQYHRHLEDKAASRENLACALSHAFIYRGKLVCWRQEKPDTKKAGENEPPGQ